jgi:threonine synthase
MAQIVYYVSTCARLGDGGRRPVAFSVPTGNFGNVLAGYAASRMGAPVERLVLGSNRNDILTRFLHTGRLEISEVHPTLSPSMDIQVSSNLERLLFELFDRDGRQVADLLVRFREEGAVTIEPDRLARMRSLFDAVRIDDEETISIIKATYERTGVLVDPHTAVGLGAAEACRPENVPMVALATAHPAKFPDAVEKATGIRPPLPPHLSDLLTRPEHVVTLANDLDLVREYVASTTTV